MTLNHNYECSDEAVTGIAGNGLRLCDGCEALDLSVGATCTKPLLGVVRV